MNPFNFSDVKVANLRGNHYADSIYCRKLVKHPGDVEYAWVQCLEIVEEVPDHRSSTLAWDDRVYTGTLHIRGIVGIDEVPDDSEQ